MGYRQLTREPTALAAAGTESATTTMRRSWRSAAKTCRMSLTRSFSKHPGAAAADGVARIVTSHMPNIHGLSEGWPSSSTDAHRHDSLGVGGSQSASWLCGRRRAWLESASSIRRAVSASRSCSVSGSERALATSGATASSTAWKTARHGRPEMSTRQTSPLPCVRILLQKARLREPSGWLCATTLNGALSSSLPPPSSANAHAATCLLTSAGTAP